MYNAKGDPRPTPCLEACSAKERAAAERIIAACKDKPIRVMGPMDYSAGWNLPKQTTDESNESEI